MASGGGGSGGQRRRWRPTGRQHGPVPPLPLFLPPPPLSLSLFISLSLSLSLSRAVGQKACTATLERAMDSGTDGACAGQRHAPPRHATARAPTSPSTSISSLLHPPPLPLSLPHPLHIPACRRPRRPPAYPRALPPTAPPLPPPSPPLPHRSPPSPILSTLPRTTSCPSTSATACPLPSPSTSACPPPSPPPPCTLPCAPMASPPRALLPIVRPHVALCTLPPTDNVEERMRGRGVMTRGSHHF